MVAVRSSATAEDLPGLSFAGQQETYLNVQGVSAVLEAVKNCWASLWTARAIGYRMHNQIDHEAVSLAVVVQMQVSADAAGILFTANPLTSQRDQVMLSASWGLGEAIVGGQVTPDMLSVDKDTGRVLEHTIGDKQVMTVRVEGGTEIQPVPEALRRIPVLDFQQAAELTRLGVQVEQLYHCPQDIEWAIADGKLYLLQSRPITTLPGEDPTAGEPNATLTGDYLWTNNIVGEVFPTVTTPSTWSPDQTGFAAIRISDFPSRDGRRSVWGMPATARLKISSLRWETSVAMSSKSDSVPPIIWL